MARGREGYYLNELLLQRPGAPGPDGRNLRSKRHAYYPCSTGLLRLLASRHELHALQAMETRMPEDDAPEHTGPWRDLPSTAGRCGLGGGTTAALLVCATLRPRSNTADALLEMDPNEPLI